MKLRPSEMLLLELDYGDLVRPDFAILSSRGWGQGPNATTDLLIVYGPKHESDRSICATSSYVLPPGDITPDGSDCDGVLVPSDRTLQARRKSRRGQLAVKF
jgi:hypothetical protein